MLEDSDGNYRAVIPLILALILYKDREVEIRNMANLLSLKTLANKN